MIQYISTRGSKNYHSFSDAILKGIAEDGGLFVPEEIPHVSPKALSHLVYATYQNRAEVIFDLFQLDFSKEIIHKMVASAYADNFDIKEIAPLIHVRQNQYMLELWHGPTAAFKDIALQIMPLFFSEAVKKDNGNRIKSGKKPLKYLILVATSGDTGKAALEGYKNKEDIAIVVLYPHNHVSQLQKLQMATQEGNNVSVYAIEGDFDTTQRLVKDIFNDNVFNQLLLKNYNTVLSSANSINWGRLLPQIVYHISGYLDLVKQGVIKLQQEVDIVVPTGNFGNILAAYYAKKMGLPIRRLICASNANNVLTEFIKSGTYSIQKRTLVKTPSPSMDILIASNIERLLYLITQNPILVTMWMRQLKEEGQFSVDNKTKSILQNEFFADWVSNKSSLENIKNIFNQTDYLMDPHTSVAYATAEKYREEYGSSLPIIICSTAHWSKFAEDMYTALFPKRKTIKDEFGMIRDICSLKKNIIAPVSITTLKHKEIKFNTIVKDNKQSTEQIIVKDIIEKLS